jgi:beta-aspartyl-peptidase (threonine type)
MWYRFICIINKNMLNNFAIAIHGGAGTILKEDITDELYQRYYDGLKNALSCGLEILKQGGSSVDAVEAAVICLENNPLFNAGKGAVYNHEGKHEMDACIMNGSTLNAGAACGVSNVCNPVMLARKIMEENKYVLLAGKGAEEFAKQQHLKFADDDYFADKLRYKQWQEAKEDNRTQLDHAAKKFGTVGAVALDTAGNLAAATSTGGLTNKQFGRVGDTPVVGAGTYANKQCAISCTGEGEFFLRAVAAYDVACLIDYKGMDLHHACNLVIMEKMVELGGEGGLIAVDTKGHIEMVFNSAGMYRACADSNGKLEIKIYKD